MTQAGLPRDLTEGEAGAGQCQKLLIRRSGLAMPDRPGDLDPHTPDQGDRTRREQVEATNIRVRIPSDARKCDSVSPLTPLGAAKPLGQPG